MSGPLRLEYAGALYHITSRGNERKPIYWEDADFERFLEVLGEVCKRFNWVVHSGCLMTNHYHLLVETPDANLSSGMRQLNGVYTLRFNRKHGRLGHLFQGRYKGILVDKSAYLLELNRYIVLNPVRARIVDSPDEWLWSSYHCTLGEIEPPSWLAVDATLLLFSRHRQQACMRFSAFVTEGVGIRIWEQLKQQVFLGDEAFVTEQLSIVKMQGSELSEVPLIITRAPAKELEFYQKQFQKRDEAMVAAYRSGGFSMAEIGSFFGVHYSTVSRACAKCKN